MFVTFEGIEGSGKSTQSRRFGELLGPGTVLTREPGGTAAGREMRAVLLDPDRAALAPMAELLLFFADRAQHVAEVVRPALARGHAVVCDRYVDSTIAYQGYGRGLPLADIHALAAIATGGLQPDLVVLLDIPVALGMARVSTRGGPDKLEAEAAAFHERVRAGYLDLAQASPHRWVRIDASGNADDVAARVREAALPRVQPVHVR